MSRFTSNTVNKLKDLPEVMHFAALVESSTTHYTPGDERSRTNPGHGYPESYDTVNTLEYIPLKDEAAVKEWVEFTSRSYPYERKLYKIIRVNPVKIETQLTVNVV